MSQAVGGQGLARVRRDRGGHVLGVAVHAAQGVGGEGPLELQPDVAQAQMMWSPSKAVNIGRRSIRPDSSAAA
jgi:hypothetical protein